jgi:hypothetical protein
MIRKTMIVKYIYLRSVLRAIWNRYQVMNETGRCRADLWVVAGHRLETNKQRSVRQMVTKQKLRGLILQLRKYMNFNASIYQK